MAALGCGGAQQGIGFAAVGVGDGAVPAVAPETEGGAAYGSAAALDAEGGGVDVAVDTGQGEFQRAAVVFRFAKLSAVEAGRPSVKQPSAGAGGVGSQARMLAQALRQFGVMGGIAANHPYLVRT